MAFAFEQGGNNMIKIELLEQKAAVQPSKVNRRKRNKHEESNAPKHPLTSYIRFSNDRRESIRTANPNLAFGEITKMIANEWSNLSADMKQPYQDAYEEAREQYKIDFNAYKQTDEYKRKCEEKRLQKKAKKCEAVKPMPAPIEMEGTTEQPTEDTANTTAATPTNKTASNEEKTPDSSDNNMQKTKTNKVKKRKKPKDAMAPRHPLTGYVRFLNDRRESVRSANPNLPFAEITKLLASEWSNLPADKKQHYLDAAERDRVRYTIEYNAYKQTDEYKKKCEEKQSQKKLKENKEEVKTPTQQVQISKDVQNDLDMSNFDIPIFTEEFLDHNKMRDSELRQLRKSNTDYEQQNAILEKHIENMKSAIEKLESEILQQQKTNSSLQQHLDHLRTTLTNGFSGVKLPGIKETASLQTIDNYMTNLHSILLENSSHDAKLLQTVRDIVGHLEFNG